MAEQTIEGAAEAVELVPEATATYYAKSILLSRTFWVNMAVFTIAILNLTELHEVIPQWTLKYLTATAAVVNLGLRYWTTRPVELVRPSRTVPVEVRKL